MQISREKLFDAVMKQAHFKYHGTCSNLDMVINNAVAMLEWVVGSSDDSSVATPTVMKIKEDFVYDLKTEVPEKKAVESAARAVFNESFYRFKKDELGWDFFIEVKNYMADVIKINYKNYVDSGLLDAAMDDFVKYYDPKYPTWKTFASSRLEKTWNNTVARDNRSETWSPVGDGDKNDSGDAPAQPTMEDVADNDACENIMKLDVADFICDVIKRADKYTKPEVYKQFRCFFTFQIAEWIELNDYIYRHVERHRNSYDEVVDIDFLNHYVDYECHTITDAYGKNRKLLSAFSETGEDIPCNVINSNGAPQVIYASYLGKSVSSISQNYKKYKNLVNSAERAI